MLFRYFNTSTLIVIIITFILFILALFSTGFTHDLLLEAGVFLVSVKLIMMTYNNNLLAEHMKKELTEIKALLKEQDNKH